MTCEDEASGAGGIVAERKADQNLEANFLTQDISAISRSLDFILYVMGNY